ncbi:hypothetical protein ACJX0J_034955, partial [Zea mays]
PISILEQSSYFLEKQPNIYKNWLNIDLTQLEVGIFLYRLVFTYTLDPKTGNKSNIKAGHLPSDFFFTTGVVGFLEFLKSVTSIDCRFWYIDCVGGQLMTSVGGQLMTSVGGQLMTSVGGQLMTRFWLGPVFMYNPIAVGLLMNAAIFQAADIMHKDKEITIQLATYHYLYSVDLFFTLHKRFISLSTATADSQALGLPFLLVPTSMEYLSFTTSFELGKIIE